MHPEVRQDGPGACPKCGMALEPLTAARRGRGGRPRAAGHDAAVLGRRGAGRRRCWCSRWRHMVGAALAGRPRHASGSSWRWPRRSCCWCGWPLLVRGWRSLVTVKLNMFTLIAHRRRRRRGSTAWWPRWRPASSRPRSAARAARWPSTSRRPASSPRWCCSARCWRSGRAGGPGRPSRPCSAWRPRPPASSASDGTEEDVPLEEVQIGDRLRVRPGEKVPVDGEVVEGRSQRRRVDDHRRADAGREGRPATRSSAPRSTPPAASSWRPSRSAATRCWRRSSRWSARRSAAGRPIQRVADVGGRLLRAGGGAGGGRHVRRLGARRPGAGHGLRHRQRGGGADHRLPVRAGAGHADVDHGRRRARARSRAC